MWQFQAEMRRTRTKFSIGHYGGRAVRVSSPTVVWRAGAVSGFAHQSLSRFAAPGMMKIAIMYPGGDLCTVSRVGACHTHAVRTLRFRAWAFWPPSQCGERGFARMLPLLAILFSEQKRRIGAIEASREALAWR